jgi:hypothetical protein
MVEISVQNSDIMLRPCDLLILKHAEGFYGVDGAVSQKLSFSSDVQDGQYVFAKGRGIEATRVLFIGVGPLQDFRYEKIRSFASRSLGIAATLESPVRTICSPVHGPGYGLDDKEAFLSLIAGFDDAIRTAKIPKGLRSIEVVEQNSARARRFQRLLNQLPNDKNPRRQRETLESFFVDVSTGNGSNDDLSSFGARSEKKRKLFVAMPFAEAHSDVWEIAIQEACMAADLVCERIAEAAFTGDIVQQIRNRVASSSGLLAVLDDANPNVYLELGYAWGLNKPTILMAKDHIDKKLPFDVQGQKCLLYKSIADLRTKLSHELKALKQQGEFD